MSLIDEVQGLCERLAPLGWHDLLLLHGLDTVSYTHLTLPTSDLV